MGNVQQGYGHGDVVGVPFDFYSGATAVASNTTFTMQTGILVLFPAGAVTGVVINLPLNPVDGAVAEITNAGLNASTVTCTINANTGDAIINQGAGSASAVTVITPSAVTTAGSAALTLRYRYTLNGFQPASGAAINPRTWIRVQ